MIYVLTFFLMKIKLFVQYIFLKKLLMTMNILMVHEEVNSDKYHYVYIKDFNRLMYNKTKHSLFATF